MKDNKTKKKTSKKTNLNKKQKEKNSLMLQELIACSIYRKLPEDYWEKEGIGWK